MSCASHHDEQSLAHRTRVQLLFPALGRSCLAHRYKLAKTQPAVAFPFAVISKAKWIQSHGSGHNRLI